MDGVPQHFGEQEDLQDRIRRLEGELATAESALADALQVRLSWIWETDADLRLTRFVGQLEEIVGTPSQDFIGTSLIALMDDIISPAAQRQLATLREHGAFHEYLTSTRTRRGLRHVKASAKPIYDVTGTFLGYRGMSWDCTDEIAACQKAETTGRNLADAVKYISAGISVFDAEMRLVACNDRYLELLELPPQLGIPGTTYEAFSRFLAERGDYGSVDIERVTRLRLEMMKNPMPMRFERTRSNGAVVEIKTHPLPEGGSVTTFTDITDIRRHEREMAEHARVAAEHARELERSNAELEQFAYVASHDLQEPLRMVASYCQLLQRRYQSRLDADADEFIGYAVEGATRMQRLINDLLAYSRVGRRTRPHEPVPLLDVVRIALANLDTAISESSAHIDVGQLPTILGDRSQLTQLIQNLLSNAIKFRRDEAIEIRIEAKPHEDGWQITIADNGIGIPPEFVDRVFLIFQRLHDRSEYPGTGIGLAIAKKVVDQHGGNIWIESTPGEGTRFHFTLRAIGAPEVHPC